MEPESSLLCSQESYTDVFREPGESSPHPHPVSPRSILILSPHLGLGLPDDLGPSDFPTKILYAFFFSPVSCILHALPF
jgi:hypothetical protein